MGKGWLFGVAALVLAAPAAADEAGLWSVYDTALKGAKYIDLTHTITPQMPLWLGFGPLAFAPSEAGNDVEGFAKKGDVFTWEKSGFEATAFRFTTDQLGTQLDPPAHWAPEYPAIDELPPTYRHPAAGGDPDRGPGGEGPGVCAVGRRHRGLGEGARDDPARARSSSCARGGRRPGPTRRSRPGSPSPGSALDALKFLHEERHILFHGHEPLDTDATPTLEGEYWLLHNGYTQAEGVANLDQVAETGCLVAIGYAKIGGGSGGWRATWRSARRTGRTA